MNLQEIDFYFFVSQPITLTTTSLERFKTATLPLNTTGKYICTQQKTVTSNRSNFKQFHFVSFSNFFDGILMMSMFANSVTSICYSIDPNFLGQVAESVLTQSAAVTKVARIHLHCKTI